MRRLALLSVLVAIGQLALDAQPGAALRPAGPPPGPRSPRNASYTIKAALDPATHTITGTEHLIWKNITKNPASELRFHLYWNAWRDGKSTWARERALSDSSVLDVPEADRGSIDVTGMTGDFIAPDDGNKDDRTVFRVPLTKAVAPNDTIEVDIAWKAHIPRTIDRTGVLGNYYFIGQWFPKIGVLEDAGWNCHQFHASTEFFSDFGNYDVELTLPRGWVVGATGGEVSTGYSPGPTTTHRFVQEDVHDFAWVTSPDLLDRKASFDERGLPPVDIRLLLQPEHAAQADRLFNVTRVALREYGRWFGPYPYGHLTVVDPVTITAGSQGGDTGGMEYPTLITAGTQMLAPAVDSDPEGVIIHEAGHQWWYGMVATNEFEHAWMDEGLNSFSAGRVMARGMPPEFLATQSYFGGLVPWAYPDVPMGRDAGGGLNWYRQAPGGEVPSGPSFQFYPPSATRFIYSKPALWFATLERHLGWPTLQRILSTYFTRYAFQHPTPDQFIAVANEVSKQDLTWFFDGVYRSAAVFDYAVGEVNGGTVAIRRLREGVFPVDVLVTFADGKTVTEHWDGKARWKMFDYGADVTRVQIDPARVLLLDVNYTNNSWTAQPQASRASWKWSLRWLTWVEELLQTYAFFS